MTASSSYTGASYTSSVNPTFSWTVKGTWYEVGASIAEYTAPPPGAQVTLDANATADVNGYVTGTITNNNLTVGTGSNRCLVAQLNFWPGGITPTPVAVTWNGISLTQIGTKGTTFLFGLANPSSGNHALVATWSGGYAYTALNGTSFTNCAQTGTFINVNTATGTAGIGGTSSLAVTNPSGNIAVESVGSDTGSSIRT